MPIAIPAAELPAIAPPELPAAASPELAAAQRQFYLRTMEVLNAASLPYLVGGGYALGHYTGIIRDTKDFDIFVLRADYDRIMEALAGAGFQTELTFPHWLGKASCAHGYIDVIFSSGNGVAVVDEEWFRYASAGEAFGLPVKLCPVEEMIWSKAFIMERERYDSADVMHLLLACAGTLDWMRLLRRFGDHWRVLLAHLCLYGFVYPSERARIPGWIVSDLTSRLEQETRALPPMEKLCQGTLLSREQYLTDIQHWGFADARSTEGNMSSADIVLWTDAINDSK